MPILQEVESAAFLEHDKTTTSPFANTFEKKRRVKVATVRKEGKPPRNV
jgi:hypothetical protein